MRGPPAVGYLNSSLPYNDPSATTVMIVVFVSEPLGTEGTSINDIINPSIYNIIRWDERIVDQASDVPTIIFIRLFIDLGHSKLFTFIFVFF